MGAGAARRYLADQERALLDATARLRDGDRSAVRTSRVAVRRARSTLRTFRACFPSGPARQLDAALVAHARRLGTVRDLQVLDDVFVTGVAGEISDALSGWIHDRLGAELEAAWHDASAAVAAADDGELRSRFSAVLEATAPGDVRMRKRARAAARRAAKRLAGACGDPDALHDARKAAKRARYAAEVTGKVGQAARQQHVQRVLGTHHDLTVAARWLAAAPVEPAARPEALRLVGRLEVAATDCLGGLA
ncbi:CHAD domain-containing protein [Nocardioides jiangxiensis]|uniref:CHAD domain-containing protein n=1 Tax=Nocardioides jiangxiensis TaxID=3064524 RepID=A0ABT9AXU9_9ACTN|nr:CHAD domain-containing protein [Nocardioides sp. WY-20]MDO7867128.1 CHAD domain-containing protein [Nocardioides sp. WY-20]